MHLADAERTLCKIGPEIRSFNLNADLLFVPFGLPLALDDILLHRSTTGPLFGSTSLKGLYL